MSTARDLIYDALLDLGAIASGESVDAAQGADALRAINQLLDAWSLDSLLILESTVETLSLVGSQQSYTWGTGGNLATTRPLKVLDASVTVDASPTFEKGIELINRDQWDAIPSKQTTSSIPTRLWVQTGYPLVTLNFWPMPSEVKTVTLYSQKQLTSLASLNTTLSLAPGYELALRTNAAVRLAPQFGKSVSAELASTAQGSLANIKRMNIKEILLGQDQALGQYRKPFNIFTGGFP